MAKYILNFSCPDRAGIVYEISSFIYKLGGNITESAQFSEGNKFFMRTEFIAETNNIDHIKKTFNSLAKNFKIDYEIVNAYYKPKILILVSKAGHCLNHILYKFISVDPIIEINQIIGNHDDLRFMADAYDVKFSKFEVSKEDKKEEKFSEIIEENNIDFIVLARYMQILSPKFCAKYEGKIINIHHSFLPSFKGAKPYKQAYDKGVKIIGATAHFVTKDLDEGPIIEQETTRVSHCQNPKELQEIGEDIEAKTLTKAIKLNAEKRVILNGNKTVIFNHS